MTFTQTEFLYPPQGIQRQEDDSERGLPQESQLQKVSRLQGAALREVHKLPEALQQAVVRQEGLLLSQDAQLPRLRVESDR